MKNFLDIEPKIVSTDKKPLPEKPTEIELRNVSFGYNEKDGYILNNVSMKLDPYSKIAIVITLMTIMMVRRISRKDITFCLTFTKRMDILRAFSLGVRYGSVQ